MSRVELRVPTLEDAGEWHRLFADPAVMKQIGDGAVRSVGHYESFVQRQRTHFAATGLCLFSVVVEQEVIGFSGLLTWAQPWGPTGAMEVGWRLGSAHWGRGYATEAARASLNRARHVGVEGVVSLIHHENEASKALADRLGMRPRAEHVAPGGQRVIEYERSLIDDA